jgi:hypothetical protein
MNDALKRYEVTPDLFWDCCYSIDSGYDLMEAAEQQG